MAEVLLPERSTLKILIESEQHWSLMFPLETCRHRGFISQQRQSQKERRFSQQAQITIQTIFILFPLNIYYKINFK